MTSSALRVVLYEGTGAERLKADDRFAAIKFLLETGYAVTVANGARPVAPTGRGDVLVLGRFTDGLPDVSAADATVYVRALGDGSPEALGALVDDVRTESNAPSPGGWKPWFPVIDYERCTNCMQCLSFCLFGVYGVDDKGEIDVGKADQCKTDCPACSRVCPEVAIMFPKYREGPINGDKVQDADVSREKMKTDISSLLGGNIHEMLRDRNVRAQSRFTRERDDDRALNERKRCLTKLVKELDVPPEVLMSLPSADEIKRRAAEAQAAAEKARANAPS